MTTTNKIGIALIIAISSLFFVSSRNDLTSTEKLTLKIEELLNKDYLQAGRESVDITFIKQAYFSANNFYDTLTPPLINGGVKGFKIYNESNDTLGLWITTLKTTTPIRVIFYPGWSPINCTAIIKNSSNRVTTVKIGK